MNEIDIVSKNPLRLLGFNTNSIIPAGEFAAVLARAGVGKTSFLVQLAINTMLRNENVLHISLNDPVDKICLWYNEVFRHITQKYQIEETGQLWETVLPHRFIMTFQVDRFNAPRLEERLNDLIQQNIFIPKMVLIDGLPFDHQAENTLNDLKQLAETHNLHVWFTVRTHRHEASIKYGFPESLSNLSELFDTVIQLHPVGKEIHVKALKGLDNQEESVLRMDPSTMLIKET